MKKLLLLLLLVGLVAIVYYDKPANKVTFTELYPGTAAEISRLYMLDGRTGHNSTTEDKEKIDQFLQLMNSLTFTKKRNQNPRTGYLYFVDIFQGEARSLGLHLPEMFRSMRLITVLTGM